MKYFIVMLMMVFTIACSTTDDMVVNPNCEHSVTWNPDTERAEVQIVSLLPSVTICYTYFDKKICFKVVEHYYNCISFSIGDDETWIEIFAEEYCEYIL